VPEMRCHPVMRPNEGWRRRDQGKRALFRNGLVAKKMLRGGSPKRYGAKLICWFCFQGCDLLCVSNTVC